MQSLWDWLKHEPVLLQSAVQVVIGLVTSFGLHLSDVQIGSIMAFAAVMLAIATRSAVIPVSKTVTPTPVMGAPQ